MKRLVFNGWMVVVTLADEMKLSHIEYVITINNYYLSSPLCPRSVVVSAIISSVCDRWLWCCEIYCLCDCLCVCLCQRFRLPNY